MTKSDEVRLYIFRILADGREHERTELFRGQSSDDRRLRDAHHPRWNWYDYTYREVKEGTVIKQVWYRMTMIFPTGLKIANENNIWVSPTIQRVGEEQLAVPVSVSAETGQFVWGWQGK